MDKIELIKITTLIKTLYPDRNFMKDLSKDEKTMVLKVWYDILKDIPFELAEIAIKKHVCSEKGKFIPSVHDIRNNCMKTVQGEQTTGGEAWNILLRKISAYGINYGGVDKILNSVDDITKKIVDGQLRSIAMMNENDLSFAKHDFIKQYEVYSTREKENKLLPSGLKEQIEQIAAQNDLNKQLEGNNTKVLKLERAKPKPKQITDNKKFDFGKQKSQVKSIQNIISSMGNTAK
jgi:hypothetical protein